MKTKPRSRLSKRVVSTKRHTLGYMAGGKFFSVKQAKIEAAAGNIAGVRVVGDHIQAAIGHRPLYMLPEVVNN